MEDMFDFDESTEPDYEISSDYCPDCGGKVLTECRNCQSNIQIEYNGPPYPNLTHIPDFCDSCGESYPWVDPVESEKQREGDFIEIDDTDIDGHFYPELVYEINLCYRVKADQAVLVLNRKLIENLIVDILRSVFSMDEIKLFYDIDNNRTHRLSKLIDNMKSRRSEIEKYGPSLDEDFFRAVDDLKYRGDASAHTIEDNPSQEDLESKSELATDVAKILFRLRTEAKTAHRTH
ncbi:hypothetical protein C476_17012 [Natrinema limicola JCM 13563]|uniref:DUF4145 domain-containing protein n=2 Tax=Natrinema limicola TaxID=370323 RepID=M0BZZ7_9EURY|nr:hypothetical protein C476_17012 [Natrinema limicola JCM 13563]